MAAVSRIFVQGFPPSIKEAELREHFSSQSPITDAKFLTNRRIGYVGYKTPEAAEKAVKYFNKSFIRMSRIRVELAKPVSEARPAKKRNQSPPSELPARKKVAKDEPKTAPNPKLEAFVENMMAPSKTKIWSNEDSLIQEQEAEAAVADRGNDSDSEDEYQHIAKKRKVSLEKNPELEGPANKTASAAVAQSQTSTLADDEAAAILAQPEEADEQGEEGGANVPAPPASDADWLRSRTNRVLDLLQDEDLEAQELRNQRVLDAPSSQEDMKAAETDHVNAEDEASSADVVPDTLPDAPLESKPANRLFVRNLPYSTAEEELLSHFAPFGLIEEVHVSKDKRSGSSKGFGFVQFEASENAETARQALDGKPFQGRLLHVLAAGAKRERGLDDVALAKLPLKVQNQIKRKAAAPGESFKWNSMYMSTDAIISSVATRLGVNKSDVLDPTSADAAVKQAHAETNTIQETKRYFEKNGVNIDSFKSGKIQGHSDTVILVKNFPFGTTASEIRDLFAKYGPAKRLIVPPSGTIAIVEMEQAAHAKAAYKPLAYSKFKDTMLFLEKAPKNIFTEDAPLIGDVGQESSKAQNETSDALEEFDDQNMSATSTLFVRNLNFSTTTEELRDLFRPLDGFLSAKVKTRTDTKKPGQLLSMGFGFVEFRTKPQAQAALAAMNGYRLAGHELQIRASHKAVDAAEERRQEDREKKLASQRTKVIIKNLPFEANKKDVRALFSPYGQLRSVRVPKKFDSSSRGFAFADFVTTKEAANAMKALRDTHLLGRKLVLDFASADAIDPEEEIARMQEKTGRQVDKVAAQKLTSGGRKKFKANEREDDND